MIKVKRTFLKAHSPGPSTGTNMTATNVAICEKCEKPFDDPNAVVLVELNHINACLQDITLCHIEVHQIPGFRGNDWADKMTLWHNICWPGMAAEIGTVGSPYTITRIKELLTNVFSKSDADKIYKYLHDSLGCRI